MSDKVNSFRPQPEPTPFDYIFHGTSFNDPDGKSRTGLPCQLLLGAKGTNITIRFEDGYTATVPRLTVRRKKGAPCFSSSSSCSPPSSHSRS